MDPITHGLLGATVAKTALWRRMPRGLGTIGALGAMAPDLDVFIWAAHDPTVGWVFHRHFTHALLFIPLGGLLAALPFLWLPQFKAYRRFVVLAATIGYATHTLLDSLTTYGTQQLWPFANTRVAWDAMPIVDPIYTAILALGLLVTARAKSPRGVRWGLALALLYVAFGFWQHERAAAARQQLLALRQHTPQQARVLPAPGWLVFWRSLYVTDGRLYADGIRLPWLGAAQVLEGGSADAITLGDLPAAAQANAEARRQFEIFAWFTGGYLTPIAGSAQAIGDQRITAAVESLTPLWGLQFDATGAPQRWTPSDLPGRDYGGLIRGLFFGDARYKRLEALQAEKRNAAGS
jgi:inner membrane protein